MDTLVEVSEAKIMFDLASKDKGLSSFILIQRPGDHNGNPFLRLCIDRVSKYGGKSELDFVELEISALKVENYSPTRKPTSLVCFHMPTFYDHVKTFLADMRGKEAKFKIVAYNNSDDTDAASMVHHSLYGVIGKRTYYLSDYYGKDHSASPVR